MGTGFDTNWVFSLAVQTDGKIIVGGGFTNYQGVESNYIIRLNSDGSRDTTFDMGTGFNSQINSIKIQNDDKILVGGNFTTYQGVGENRIIRLNSDGSRDTSFDIGTGFDNEVRALEIQNDGNIIAGGNFTTYQGVESNYVIRLNSDGSRDTSFDIGTGFDSEVRALEIQNDGKIIAGGWFTNYQGVESNYIIRLNSDGSRDTTFDMGTGFDNRVWAIDIQSDGNIVAGGDFVTYQGIGANRIIRLNSDGSRDTSFDMGTGFDNRVYTTKLQSDGKIIAGGDLNKYKGITVGKLIRLEP